MENESTEPYLSSSGRWPGHRTRRQLRCMPGRGRGDDDIAVIITRAVASVINSAHDLVLLVVVWTVQGAAGCQQYHCHHQQNKRHVFVTISLHGLFPALFSSVHCATASAAPRGSRNTATFPFRTVGLGGTTTLPPACSIRARVCRKSFTRI